MKCHRCITPLACAQDMSLTDPRIVHQIFGVLKIAVGETLVLCDGKGSDFYYSLTSSSRRLLSLRFLKKEPARPEFHLDITLYCSILKGDHFDLVVQKATELGVTTIVPVVTDRTVKKNINVSRCATIAQEASEQCGRGIVPTISTPLSYGAVQEQWRAFDRVFVADIFDTPPSIASGATSPHRIALCIGPEGGWSDTEKAIHIANPHVSPLSLSPFVLRAETAAIVGLSTLITRYEHLS